MTHSNINDIDDNIRPPDPIINEQLLDNDYNYELITQNITNTNTTNYIEATSYTDELNKALELSKREFKDEEDNRKNEFKFFY